MHITAINNGNGWIKIAEYETLKEAYEEYRLLDGEQLGVFRLRPDWEYNEPRYLIDNRDKTGWPIRGCRNLINNNDDCLRG